MATALGLGTIVIVTALGIGSLGPGLLTGGTPAAVSDAPSPSASPTEPVAVTGSMTSWDVQSYGSTVTEDGIYWSEGPWWTITWEASDPRLSGQGTRSANWNESVTTGTGIGTSTYVLVNPDGRWLGSGSFAQAEGEMSEMVVLHGEGAYDGLTASVFHQTDFSSPHTFAGVIFPGEPPTIPEPVEPPAE